jgi:hypothetical protein
MPTVQGLEFRYALHVLPPGRWGFRRWRWELWHGAALVAAGWRVSERDAGRAICRHAAAFGHRLFGLGTPPADLGSEAEALRPGRVHRLVAGAVTCVLTPRELETPRAPGLAGPTARAR